MSRRGASSFAIPRRNKPVADEKSLLVLATEGETERGYIEGIFRAERDRIGWSLVLAEKSGTDPRSVVQSAVDKIDEHKRRKDWRTTDRAFALFDGDEHFQTADRGKSDRWHEAFDLAQAHGIETIVTNPSFEWWVVLHFRYSTANLHRDRAFREAEERVIGYQKGREFGMELYGKIKDETPRAITNARRLREHAVTASCGPFDNPCSHMDRLVTLLLPDQV